MIDISTLADQHCAPCEDGTQPMTGQAVQKQPRQLSEQWKSVDDAKIVGEFKFKNYYRTQAFVNATAYIAHREDHHPNTAFGYNTCTIELTTHAIDGLSDSDFISAARIDRLLD